MSARSSLFTPVLIGACLIIILNFAVRGSFGVFQIPIATEFGWLRSDFSLAIAVQNLAWGFGQPVFGAIAERYGDRRAMVGGRCCMPWGWFCLRWRCCRSSISCWRYWWALASQAPDLASFWRWQGVPPVTGTGR